MTYLNSWEEFEKGAERLYLQNPMKVCICYFCEIESFFFLYKSLLRYFYINYFRNFLFYIYIYKKIKIIRGFNGDISSIIVNILTYCATHYASRYLAFVKFVLTKFCCKI